MASLNQPEGDKKLLPFLNRIRSNKLRTIIASMLAFDEIKRADYATILRYLNMNEMEFTTAIMNQYIPHIPSKSPPIFG